MKSKNKKIFLYTGAALFILLMLQADKKEFTEADVKAAILSVREKYGVELARTIEQMFRLETAHFKSLQYKKTGTAGLTAGKWPEPVPKGPIITLKTNPALDSAGRSQINYIVWNPADFTDFLAKYIIRYNGNFGRWYSTNPALQQQYAEKVAQIKPRFV